MENVPAASTAPQPDLLQLQARYDQLQQLVSSLLLILIVISGTLSVFLRRQWQSTQADLNAIQLAAAPLMAEYANNHPGIEDFVRRLAEYGRTHPDFAPIVTKYHLDAYLASPAGSASLTNALPPAGAANK
ncbi:MAG TPA: hypothetical protein VFE51_01465 [Verrucomicrobiae bacterium]|nr:hypothetical protein [Verrucomicrobiae bacterium]